MNKTAQINLVNAAFDALPEMERGFCGSDKHLLYDMNLTGERQHRRGRGKCGISLQVAAKLFTVRFIAEALENPERYTVEDLLKFRAECIYAQAIVSLHRVEIEAAWAAVDITPAQILETNYAELMQ